MSHRIIPDYYRSQKIVRIADNRFVLCLSANQDTSFLFFFDTSHNATNHGPGDLIFEGKMPFSQRPSVRLDRRLAPIDGGFHCASDDNLFGGVSCAAVSIYLFYRARGGGGLTGGNRRKCLNTLAAARWTPSPGVPFDGVFYCAPFDTSCDGISRSVLSIYSFSTPRWRGDSAAARVPSHIAVDLLKHGRGVMVHD